MLRRMQDEDRASVAIEYSDLWTYAPHDPRTRLPLTRLPEDGRGHVHGRLVVSIRGRALPGVSLSGRDDVCLGSWAVELHQARAAMTAAADGVHIYDDGEEGQPAYVFRRCGPNVLISVIEGSGGGEADSDWQEVVCDLTDFVTATAEFEESLQATVAGQAGEAGRAWYQFVMRSG